jgi:GrpB-like predicted nucleotidyltransferase (UPF0157 family)
VSWPSGRSRQTGELVVVIPYDPEWSSRFDTESELPELVLAPWLHGGTYQVGSTAVPRLAAKPVIDMVAGLRDLDQARAAFDPLREHGYEYTPHRRDIGHHFAKPPPELGESTHSLHLTEPGSGLWRERLAFRDALRNDPALAVEYEALKRRLAQVHANDVKAYTDGKRAFVARVLDAAGIQLDRQR